MESINDIRKMLDKFYRGETSLEEEQRLRETLASVSVPEELRPDQELFRSMEKAADIDEVPEDLNLKIINAIDQAERKANRTRRITLYSLSGLAAGLLLMITVYLFYVRTDNQPLIASNQMTDTYQDPMDAYNEAKKALVYVSNKLNTGTSELEQVKKVTKVSTDPLKSLSKINSGSKELSLLGQLRRAGEIQR
jgi:hypothetical protein